MGCPGRLDWPCYNSSFAAAASPGRAIILCCGTRAGRGRAIFFISPAGGWAGLDDEDFLKDLGLGNGGEAEWLSLPVEQE